MRNLQPPNLIQIFQHVFCRKPGQTLSHLPVWNTQKIPSSPIEVQESSATEMQAYSFLAPQTGAQEYGGKYARPQEEGSEMDPIVKNEIMKTWNSCDLRIVRTCEAAVLA
ncbi:hypothetical protein E4U19_005366 [Claviceps sp. Clav32 group G5]|nr:hypothetical protein E4U19_005366 [Claviceps sp. Clav32 group G5]